MSDPFLRLGRLVARRPWWFIAVWLLAITFGAIGAHRLQRVTVGVEGGVPGSPSHRAGELLRTEFSNPFLDPLVVAVSAPHLKVSDAPLLGWLKHTEQTLSGLGGVHKVASFA